MVAETASSAAAVSLSGSEITFDRLQKFWNDLPPQARQELLRIDKQTLIEQARKNLYCSRCNGLLLECFTQIVIYGKSLQQEGSGVSFPRRTNESRITEGEPDKIQDPTVHPWGCLATTKDGIITLLDCFINAKSLQALQNVFNSARAREREREMLYPDACGGGGRGWISQGMANYSRSHGTRETCALHTARLSCDTLVNFWSALSEETRSSLLRMKEEDFIERLMYRFDSKRFCRDCRRNVIREFKELKELKRMRKEPRCTSWFCVADTDFQCEVFEDTVLVDWHRSFSETDGPYHRFEWAIGTDEGKSDVLDFEDVGMNRQVHRNGLNLDQFDDYFVTLRAWGPDDHCTELCVKAHALKGQSCVHHRLIVGDGFVTITKGESIRSFFEYAEEAEEEDEDDAMDRDGNDLDGDGSHPQKHAKSPELAREFLLDAATVIFKEQIEKAFREGTARQNAHSVFVSLALELLEERVHVACKEIITLEKQTKLLEEEEREKREEEERRMRRRIKEREKKHRRKERLKEKGRDKEKKLFQSKLSDDVSPSSLSNSSTSTNDESPNTPESRDSASEDEDNVAVVEPCSHDTAIDQSSSREDNGQINDDHYDIVSEFAPTDCTDSLISEQHKSSRRKMRLRKDFPQDQASCCWYDGCQDESGSSGDQHWQSRERTRNSARSGSSVFSSNNRTRDRYDYNPCSCGHQEDYRIKDSYFSSAARSGREIKMVRRTVVEKPRLQYRRCYPLDSIILSKGSRVGSSPNKIVSAKQVWEPMDARKKSSLGNTNNGSETVDNLDQPKAAECNKDIDECQKLDTGCEPLAEICSEGSEVVDKLDTDQPSEKGGKNEAVCHNGSDVVDKQDCCSADDGDSEHDTGLMTNSASSDSSSCPTEADSSTSSLTSLSAQNTESSSASDSEESSEGNDIIAGHPSTGIASRSLLETCAGNGFREYQPKAIHPSNYDRTGFSMPSFQDQSVHHQTMHVPPYSSATMAFHNHSWAPLTNGYFPYPHPGHFYSSPVGYGVAGKQHVNYPMQYNNAYPYPASAFGCMPPPSIHKTAPSFSVIPLHRHTEMQQIRLELSVLLATQIQTSIISSKLKPMGLKGDTKDTGRPADNSAPFSLFQFNLPIAPPAPPSSKGEKSGELVSRTSVAQVQVQPCSREEENIKVYKLFSTRNGGILPFL